MLEVKWFTAMIRQIKIKNFKSIETLELELGRFNVFIGENGSGKTNVLEAIAFGGAAAADKLDNEFLSPRGIRVTNPQLMRSAFDTESKVKEIGLQFSGDDKKTVCFRLNNENKPYSRWLDSETGTRGKDIPVPELSRFIIYYPENTTLRVFEKEGQILPLGIRGEGLFKLLKNFLAADDKAPVMEIKEHLKLIDWFEDFGLPEISAPNEFVLEIKDRFLGDQLSLFDQRSSNEGFLFLLFYLCLFISKDTPPFFAVDNLEASFNPKLCAEVAKTLIKLAAQKEKQVIVTTHNPSILDGINLHDPEQRLFVIKRNTMGHTIAKRITAKPDSKTTVKLSDAWTRGYIGGLPKNF